MALLRRDCRRCAATDYSIAKLEPKQGDVLIVQAPRGASSFDVEQLEAQVRRLVPDIVVVVVAGPLKASIARRLNVEELGIAAPGC